jgi:hypothetical protein
MEDVSQLVCHQRGVGVDSHPLGRPGVHFAMALAAGPYRGPVATHQSQLQGFRDEPMVLQAFRHQQVGKPLTKVDDEGLRHGIPSARRRNRLGGLAGRDWGPSRLKGQVKTWVTEDCTSEIPEEGAAGSGLHPREGATPASSR